MIVVSAGEQAKIAVLTTRGENENVGIDLSLLQPAGVDREWCCQLVE
tara:strand:- start:10 stop:150 length:141 start_codon:yes stop_codon:yes gene_type:complete